MRRAWAVVGLVVLAACGGAARSVAPTTVVPTTTTTLPPATTIPSTTLATTTTSTTSPLTAAESAFIDEARHLGGTGTNADLLNFGNSICIAAKSGAAESLAVTLAGSSPKAVRTQYALIITAAGDKLCPQYANAIILAASKVAQIPGA